MTGQDFIGELAVITGVLSKHEWTGQSQPFALTLRTMAEDSARWIESGWVSPAGISTPIERAIVVLCQDMIVLLGYGAQAGIQHEELHKLATCAIAATAAGVIVDPTHVAYFTDPESPLHAILSDED